MHTFIQFTGDNWDEVLNFTPGFVRCKGKTIRLMIFLPMRHIVEVSKGDYIINDNNYITIKK